jgi:acyl dehydratase
MCVKVVSMKTFNTLQDVQASIGQAGVVSDWLTVTQDQVNQFAEATGDHQWIHIDPERAKEGPFGTTIAHGFLTLSLLPRFYATAFKVENVRMGVNYGLNKVRFTSPVPVGSRLRAQMTLQACEPIDNNGMQLTWLVSVQREGSDKPVCVAESLTRLYA